MEIYNADQGPSHLLSGQRGSSSHSLHLFNEMFTPIHIDLEPHFLEFLLLRVSINYPPRAVFLGQDVAKLAKEAA